MFHVRERTYDDVEIAKDCRKMQRRVALVVKVRILQKRGIVLYYPLDQQHVILEDGAPKAN